MGSSVRVAERSTSATTKATAALPVSQFRSQSLSAEATPVVNITENQHTDDTGYMLFPRPGKYMVWVQQGTHLLGSVVFQVG